MQLCRVEWGGCESLSGCCVPPGRAARWSACSRAGSECDSWCLKRLLWGGRSTLERMQPRVVSYEEAVMAVREQLAELLEGEEDWAGAAKVLAGIDLDSGELTEGMSMQRSRMSCISHRRRTACLATRVLIGWRVHHRGRWDAAGRLPCLMSTLAFSALLILKCSTI